MRPFARVLAASFVMAFVVSGCWVARVEGPPQDDLSTWSDTPLPPDVELQASAVRPNGSCTSGPEGRPVTILLQDRRTEWTAAFLFAGVADFGSCLVTSAGGASSGGSGPLPEPLGARVLSIDANGFGDIANGKGHELGGQVVDEATRVLIELADGQSVTASVADGYWLAWWPGDVAATNVTAFDSAGAELGSVEVPQ